MATLLRVGEGDLKDKSEHPPVADPVSPLARRRLRLLQISLWVADLLLLGAATRLALNHRGAFGALDIALCVGAVLTGAWLACLACWLD